jgi:hypothetical protein
VGEALGRSAVEHLAAVLAGGGTDVDDPVRAADHLDLVLDDEERVARGLEARERAQQRLGVGGMEAGRGLVEDVDHAEQVGADLRREAQPLQLTRRQGRRAALEREVAEAEIEQHAEARAEVLCDPLHHDDLLGMRGLLRDLVGGGAVGVRAEDRRQALERLP